MKEKIIFLLILKTQSYYNIFSKKSKTSFSEKLFTQEFFREPEKRHFFFMHGEHADFEEMLADFGLNTSVAINIFARQVVYERRIPFAIARDRPNAATRAAMEDTRARRGLSKTFSSVKDLMADLDA